MIELEGVVRGYPASGGWRRVLDGLHLSVSEGEMVAVLGVSGSGKTTLLNVTGGLDRDFSGRVVVGGTELASLDESALSRFRARTLGFVVQAYHLLDHLTSLDNVTLPAVFGDGERGARWREVQDRGRQLLERVGLGDRGGRPPSELSGGERQRVALARALFGGPRLLLCDEMTGNLDDDSARRVIDLVEAVNREQGVTVLAASHDERLWRRMDRVLLLEEGRLVAAAVGERT